MTRCPPRLQCRGVVPAVSHIMLHSDTLAQEFNEILNGVEIFAPFQPLDPAVTFYAPLRNTVRDLRLNQDDFQRASDAWYKDGSGIYRYVGINRARFEQSRLLMEPAKTNKSENYNADPDPALTNIGGSGGTVSVVHRPDLIRDAGLSDLCPNGNVIELDNVGGGANANILFNGPAGNTSVHTASVWARRTKQAGTGIEVRLGMSVGVAGNTPITTEWKRYSFTAETSAGSEPRIIVEPDFGLEVILNQFEESPIATSPIVTEGTAGQRAIDALSYDNPSLFFNQSAGMALIDWSASFGSGEMTDGNWTENLLSTEEDRFNLLFLRSPAAQGVTIQSQMANGQTAQGPALIFNVGDAIRFAVRWNRSANQFQVGQRINSGPWVWGTEITSNLTDFDLGNDFYIAYLPAVWPSRLSDAYLYNEDRGRAWIEGNH